MVMVAPCCTSRPRSPTPAGSRRRSRSLHRHRGRASGRPASGKAHAADLCTSCWHGPSYRRRASNLKTRPSKFARRFSCRGFSRTRRHVRAQSRESRAHGQPLPNTTTVPAKRNGNQTLSNPRQRAKSARVHFVGGSERSAPAATWSAPRACVAMPLQPPVRSWERTSHERPRRRQGGQQGARAGRVRRSLRSAHLRARGGDPRSRAQPARCPRQLSAARLRRDVRATGPG